MQPKFSIIINTYNRAHTLPRALDSLGWIRYPHFEVIVVNGPSTDNTAQVIEPYLGRIKYAQCSEANLSKSRNIGIALAAGDIVCFMDDDAVPEPDWLNELKTGYSAPEVAAVGGYIRDHSGYTFQCKAVICDRLGNGESFETVEQGRPDNGLRPFRFPSLTGTNSSFKRDALLSIGGFDEEYAYFLDETDVIVRLLDQGYRVEYVPNAEVHHKYAASHLRDTNRVPRSIYYSVRSKAYFCIRHGMGATSLDHVMRHLESYQVGLKRDYRWYLEHGVIGPEHHAQLLDDIQRGIHDGVADGFAATPSKFSGLPAASRMPEPFLRYEARKNPSDRLRICFLSQDYPPRHCGGIGRWTHELATSLAREGHEISVVTRGEGHPTVDFEDGVWVHRIIPVWQPHRTIPQLPGLPQIIKDYAYTAYDEVMRIHVRRGLDIVSSPIWDLEGAACIADASIPTVLSLHSTFKLVLPSKPEWLRNPEYKAGHVDKIIDGERWALQKAHHILANSKAIIRDVEAAYDVHLELDRYAVIPHGIEKIGGSPADTRPEDRGTDVRLLFVGRFEKRKGIDLLLAALPDLMAQYPHLHADLVGDNAIAYEEGVTMREQFLSEHAGEPWLSRVSFPGVVDDQRLVAYYRNCDIFAAPSRYESFGLVFLEAMRFAKACVGARVGGIEEVIDDERTGLLPVPDDVGELKTAITRLIESPSLRNSLGEAALRVFNLEFASEVMAGRVEQTYRSWSAAGIER